MKERADRRGSRAGSALAVVVLGAVVALGAAGCSHVKKEELKIRLDEIIRKVEDSEARLSGRMDEVDGRVDGLDQRVGTLEERTAALEEQLRTLEEEFGATIERLEGMVAFDMPVHFDFDSARVRELDKPVLDRFAAVVTEFYPGSLVTVEGFADPAGPQAYNRDLGRRRAEAVKDYLAAAGIDSGRLRAVSYGEATERQVVPGAQGPGSEGLENRRVSLVIDSRSGGTGEPDGTTEAEES